MAERERLTNKERRAAAREERRRKEAEAARKKQRGQLRTGLITLAIVAVVAAVVIQAFVGGPATIDDPILISTSDADQAREAAGCEVLTQEQPLPDASHMEASPSRDLSTVYTDVRPTHSGPHTPSLHPVGTFDRQIDEFNSTHNLEHGAIIVWWDPDQAGDASGDIEDWAETLNANGFSNSQMAQFGVGIITSRYEDPGLSSGKGIAFRAWGAAMDCDAWDETAANSFVIDNYGTHGIAPERGPATYPTDVLAYEDADVGDTPEDEAPVEGDPGDPADPEDQAEDDPGDDEGDDG